MRKINTPPEEQHTSSFEEYLKSLLTNGEKLKSKKHLRALVNGRATLDMVVFKEDGSYKNESISMGNLLVQYDWLDKVKEVIDLDEEGYMNGFFCRELLFYSFKYEKEACIPWLFEHANPKDWRSFLNEYADFSLSAGLTTERVGVDSGFDEKAAKLLMDFTDKTGDENKDVFYKGYVKSAIRCEQFSLALAFLKRVNLDPADIGDDIFGSNCAWFLKSAFEVLEEKYPHRTNKLLSGKDSAAAFKNAIERFSRFTRDRPEETTALQWKARKLFLKSMIDFGKGKGIEWTGLELLIAEVVLKKELPLLSKGIYMPKAGVKHSDWLDNFLYELSPELIEKWGRKRKDKESEFMTLLETSPTLRYLSKEKKEECAAIWMGKVLKTKHIKEPLEIKRKVL
jgi:hypothetical protein